MGPEDLPLRYPTLGNGKSSSIVPNGGYGTCSLSNTCIRIQHRFCLMCLMLLLKSWSGISDFGSAVLHPRIGFVGQEPILFNSTVRENILYGMEPWAGMAVVFLFSSLPHSEKNQHDELKRRQKLFVFHAPLFEGNMNLREGIPTYSNNYGSTRLGVKVVLMPILIASVYGIFTYIYQCR